MAIEEQDIHLENRVFQVHLMRNDMVEAQDGVKDADVMYQFKNMIYICVDNVSEKLQLP